MLFEPFTLRNLTIKNRVVMPPMCVYSAGREGKTLDWHILHYGARAVGQVGLIIVEATGVQDCGRTTANDLGIWDDSQIIGLRRLTALVRAQGAKVGIQLNHAGRKSEVEYLEPVGPSAIPFSDEHRTPKVLSTAGILQIVEDFRQAAQRAVTAGFNMIEIHAAHGYLINQFMSPLTNQRTDRYGGSLENRARLLQEVTAAVRDVVPEEMPVVVRVSAYEYADGGNTPVEVAQMINLVKPYIDAVDVSSGGVVPAVPKAYPGYQIGFAATIKEWTGLPVIGGGLITEPMQAEQVAKAGIDLVSLGRELLRNPYWALKAAHELGQDIAWPIPYLRSKF